MGNDYTNTAEHHIPIPAITDQYNFTREITNLRTRLSKAAAGTAAYDANADNYVLTPANAGAILSSQHGGVGGKVLAAAQDQDPTLTFYTHTGAALVAEWTVGADDSDTDALAFSTGADLSSPKLHLTEAGELSVGAGSSPGALLHVDGGGTIPSLYGDTVCVFQKGGGGAGTRVSIFAGTTGKAILDLGDDVSQGRAGLLYDNSDDSLKIRANNGNQIYVNSTGTGLGKTPASRLDLDLSTEDLEIVDAGSVSATQQDWIEVEVAGNTGYIHVYAGK
jgi:hypothetical protein